MEVVMFSYYKEFKCIAGECSDSCCDGWKIIIDEKSTEKYMDADGAFGERLQENLVTGGKENYFQLCGSRCPFLNKENLCDIYINMGEAALSSTCSAFPRIIRQQGNRMEACLTLACPEAARLLLADKLKFKIVNQSEKAQLRKLDEGQEIIINILQNEKYTLYERIVAVFIMGNAIEDAMLKNDEEQINDVLEQFGDEDMLEEFEASIPKQQINVSAKAKVVYELLECYMKMCFSRKHDGKTIQLLHNYIEGTDEQYLEELLTDRGEAFEKYVSEKHIYDYENLLVYYVFRHYKDADREGTHRILTMMMAQYVVTKYMGFLCYCDEGKINMDNQIEIFHYYSKIMEHSSKDYEKMRNMVEEREYDSIGWMVTMI